LVAGRFDFRAPGGVDGAVVGQKLAELLDLTPGIDSITILTTNPNRIDPMTGLPPALVKSFLVTGLIETGMYEYDSKYVYVSLDVLQDLLQLDGDVTGLEIRAPSRDEAPELAKRIQDTIGISLRADDWQTQNKTLFSALKLEKFAMTFIFGLIVLVAAFQIVGTLTMVVYDKTREIGILRAMGMPAAVVKRVFFFQGLLIGSAGTVTGLSLGLIVSYVIDRYHLIHLAPDVYFIDHLPAATDPVDVLLIALGSMVIAALATALPARQAARLYPVDAIRHE
jgi:lipoprotein-releasing system permease protein